MTKYKKVKIKKSKEKDFWIMNRDAKFFVGLLAGDVIWTDNEKEAKVFNDPNNINALKRWKSIDEPQIIYIDKK